MSKIYEALRQAELDAAKRAATAPSPAAPIPVAAGPAPAAWPVADEQIPVAVEPDRKSTRLNSSHRV